MQVVNRRCCGLDVHKKQVTACVIAPGRRETRTFSTMTRGLVELSDWLRSYRVSHVAMESTGVYWKPVYNLLEGKFTLLLVNAQHIKGVPGRKTDVSDAEWIADLLRHGLVRGSFVPDRNERELRELTRYRRSLVQQRSQVVNRIQKVLEGANIKLSAVATDVVGVSGRAMLEAMVKGVKDPEALASLAKGSLRKKHASLEEALYGMIGAHQRKMLQSQLRLLDFLDREIVLLSDDISERMGPCKQAIERLDTIPGMGQQTAEEILAEIGQDMGRFPSDQHLASWARVCPGNNESAGKRKSGRAGHGNRWLRSPLVQVAWAAVRTKHTYLCSLYHRIAARRGSKRAILAVGHSILRAIYFMLKNNTSWQDLGETYFDQRNQKYTIFKAVRRLQSLGYIVNLVPAQDGVFSG